MDNNTGNRPRKRVTKKMLRQRQLGALAVISFLVLLFVVLIFKGCSGGGSEKKGGKQEATTTTTTLVTTTVPATTLTTTTTHPLAAEVIISKREMFIDVGGSDISYITGYPTGSSEANEVWKSLDESVAKVDNLGYVTGIGQGETFIILSFDNNPGIEIEIKVHVAGTGNEPATTAVEVTPITPASPDATTTTPVFDFTTTTPVAAVEENSYTA